MAFFHHREDEAFSRPLPSLSELDYFSVMKFLDFAEEHCAEKKRSLAPVYDWLIRCLLTSLVSDSASRIFLPKTETKQFELDDLIPISSIAPSGRTEVPLNHSFVIAPAWSNADAVDAILTLQDRGGVNEGPKNMVLGVYINELNLAIISKAVHEMYFTRFWGHGCVVLDTYSLRDLEPRLSTDGECWFLQERREEVSLPVLDARMAALYSIALERYCPPEAEKQNV